MNPIARIDDNAVELLRGQFQTKVSHTFRADTTTPQINKTNDRISQKEKSSPTPNDWMDLKLIDKLKSIWKCDEFT